MAKRATRNTDLEIAMFASGPHDVVNKPSHYAGQYKDIECMDAQRSMLGDNAFLDHCRATIMSYLWRLPTKENSCQDAKKAQFYMNKIVDILSELE